MLSLFFFNDPAPTEIYTLSLHDALPISRPSACRTARAGTLRFPPSAAARARRSLSRAHRTARSRSPHRDRKSTRLNSSHTVISYAVFCLKKKNKTEGLHAACGIHEGDGP